jgi:hypothetical protein
MRRFTRYACLSIGLAAVVTAVAPAAATTPPESTDPPGTTVPVESAPMESHATESTAPSLSDVAPPVGVQLSPEDLETLKGLFDDEVLTGGQVAPRLSKWITPDTFIFVQFDGPPDEATEVRYIGVGVKGVFCAEALPDAEGGSFTHFHRPEAADYSEGHGGDPGAHGYWMSWMAVESFEARDGRAVEPGIDYEFSPTPAPECGADVPAAEFPAPNETTLSAEDLAEFVGFFDDEVLIGGQEPPRLSLWLNEQAAMFVQLDDRDPAAATTIRNIGIYVVGTFCDSQQPPDFPHYHRYSAAEYSAGHGGAPGETSGYWLAWMATQPYETNDGRQVPVGIDREFSPTPPPSC